MRCGGMSSARLKGATPLLAGGVDPSVILSALPAPVFVADAEDTIAFVNPAAESFFGGSAATLVGRSLAEWLQSDSPLFLLLSQVRERGHSLSEYGVSLEGPRFGSRFVTLDAALMPDRPGAVVVTLQERSIARKIDRQLTHRNAARSVTAMAAMLAHEVKNPLSGIRGAAQLLELTHADQDRELTRLICDEADRIVQLVDSMEMFADGQPLDHGAVNIHEVLGHVRTLIASGVGRHLKFVERYDPSLPPVRGNRDLLIQAILNLVKNAAEAAPKVAGVVQLVTRYRQGVRLAVRGGGEKLHLPLMVSIEDNGPGVPEDLQPHLFDPFVSTKPSGKGLGLALVAKIVDDHGGVIELDSEPGRTRFTLYLPLSKPTED
ncbi:MAG: nitrogen regulation protein NR(II) [Rhodospirillales bacterium]